MTNMGLRNVWVSGCLIDCFPWIDGKHIYLNVRRYEQGRSIERDPVWDKSILIFDNEQGRRVVTDFLDSFINWVVGFDIKPNTMARVEF